MQLQMLILKPVFHQKLHLRWVGNATKNETNNTKSTWPTQTQPTQYQTWLELGLKLGL